MHDTSAVQLYQRGCSAVMEHVQAVEMHVMAMQSLDTSTSRPAGYNLKAKDEARTRSKAKVCTVLSMVLENFEMGPINGNLTALRIVLLINAFSNFLTILLKQLSRTVLA